MFSATSEIGVQFACGGRVRQVGFTEKWDSFYSRYAGAYDWAVKHLPLWKNWLKRAIPEIKGPRVLEVSFGTGYLMSRYADKFNKAPVRRGPLAPR